MTANDQTALLLSRGAVFLLLINQIERFSWHDVLFMVHWVVNERKKIQARFFESDLGKLPVRDWLMSLPIEDRRIVGNDIATAEFGWPVGTPLCRAIRGRKGLWEIRSSLS